MFFFFYVDFFTRAFELKSKVSTNQFHLYEYDVCSWINLIQGVHG